MCEAAPGATSDLVDRGGDCRDDIEATFDIENIAGVEPHDFYALVDQPTVADGVVFSHALDVVSRTIDFDREHRRRRVEIEDVRPDGMLPAKSHATQSAPPQDLPELKLRKGHLTQKAAGSDEAFGGRSHFDVVASAAPSTTLRVVPLPRSAEEDSRPIHESSEP